MQKVFREECEIQYNLARKSPVMKTSLVPLNEVEEMDLELAKSLIDGRVPLPDDLDKPTRTYINELIDIGKKTPNKNDERFEVKGSKFVFFGRELMSTLSLLSLVTTMLIAKNYQCELFSTTKYRM